MNNINKTIGSLNIVNVTESSSVHVLDFVLQDKKDTDKTDTPSELKLKIGKVVIPEYDAQLKLKYQDDVEPADIDEQIINFYLEYITDKMLSTAHDATDLDIEMGVENSGRRLISKLISAATMVAVRGRRGPGNFAIMNGRNFDALPPTFNAPNLFLYQRKSERISIPNLQIYLCDSIGDTILVGRKGGSDEPGIFFKSDEIKVDDYIYEEELTELILNEKYKEALERRISHVNLRFAIESVGSVQPYVAFKTFW
jgi:hypothetical protein